MNRIGQSLLELFFPQDNACLLCGRALYGSEHLLCEKCAEKLKKLEYNQQEGLLYAENAQACISAYYHAAEAAELIHLLKYRHTAVAARILAERMVNLLQMSNFAHAAEAIVPVPVHESRLRERGYAQAELLAEPLAAAMEKPLLSRGLIRTDQGKSQVGKNRKERLEQLQNRFRADPSLVSGKNLLLVDDVYTTGATAQACIRALQAAGAGKIWMIVACRA